MKRRSKPSPLNLGPKIGERAYRDVFLAEHNRVVKVDKSHREKKYGPFRVRVPMRWQSIMKLGRVSPNTADFENYRKYFLDAPPELWNSFAHVSSYRQAKGLTQLTMERVMNFDGRPAQTLEETGNISNTHFWSRFNRLIEWFRSDNVPFVGIYPDNIMVKWVTPREAIPVIIDYKHMGKRRFPFQPWLWIPGQIEKKMIRRYARLQEKFDARGK